MYRTYQEMKTKMKSKLDTFYVRFYRTGQLCKVKAVNETEALRIATEKFGEASGNWKLGKLQRNGDVLTPTGLKTT